MLHQRPEDSQSGWVALFGLPDGGFKSADARRRYLATYDELRALTPPPDVLRDVPTEFGTVRVYQRGPDGGVPVVLIHGIFRTSAMWWEQVAGLTSDFTVYAMDMLIHFHWCWEHVRAHQHGALLPAVPVVVSGGDPNRGRFGEEPQDASQCLP